MKGTIIYNSQSQTRNCPPKRVNSSFVLPLLAINGGLIQVQNRGGLAQFVVPFPECEGPIVFADPNLEAAVREALGLQPAEPITCQQAAALVWLDATDRGIQSLEGLQAFTGLNTLYLGDNQISDLAPFAGLTRMQYLSLGNSWLNYQGGNRISDLTPLAGLTQLTDLDLNGNRIVDISALARLTQLRELYLDGSQIVDISALAGLTQLTRLYLTANPLGEDSCPILQALIDRGVEVSHDVTCP